ncbi:zinc finger MYM-type protein 5 [Mesoplodon densirostris]|uniref:zinc finger MYM-type protein 5 n=1 Tax=Mesoplodon densirostris TaxID=48708 RepID=UPI0028DC52FC|nr:zinc finger MYM-type protein 5 [Mesoplodon densirostris]
MSQAPWRAARGLRECGRGREGRVRRPPAAGVARSRPGRGPAAGGGALPWALGAALAPSLRRRRREFPKFGGEGAGPPRRSPSLPPGPRRAASSRHSLSGRVSNGGRGAGRSRAPGQCGGFRPAATRVARETRNRLQASLVDVCLKLRRTASPLFFGIDKCSAGGLDLTEQTPVLLGSKAMAASFMDVAFGDPASPLVNRSRNSSAEDDDDDVVFIESIQPPSSSAPVIADQRNFIFAASRNEKLQGNYSIILPSSRSLASQKGSISETIVIDDEEDMETNGKEKTISSSFIEWALPGSKNRTKDLDFSTSSLSRSKTKTAVGPFNPGRMNVAGGVFQNRGFTVHHSPDSWISQSASFPSNQKQPGVDSLSPVDSLPKQIFQPSAQQQPSKPAKITCANCKKPLQKGQTAYQRKGSAHLFCSTTCLSSFSHKPAPKKRKVTCKKGAPAKKATLVPQGESSESFQKFCGTSSSPYEDNQNLRKRVLNKSRCTICSKLTEIRHEVSVNNVTHKLCSNQCFNKYRLANGLVMNFCEQCGEYLPSKGAGNNLLVIEGQQMRFCCQSCVNEYKQMMETNSKKVLASENRKRNAVREENERELYGSLNILLEKIERIPVKKEKTSELQVSAECSQDKSLVQQDVNLPPSVSTIADKFQEQLEEKRSEDSIIPAVLSADPAVLLCIPSLHTLVSRLFL